MRPIPLAMPAKLVLLVGTLAACEGTPLQPRPADAPPDAALASHLIATCTVSGLRGAVNALETTGVLNRGQARALLRKLAQAESAEGRGDPAVAARAYERFVRQLDEFGAEGVLPIEDAIELVHCATELRDALIGGGPPAAPTIDGVRGAGEWDDATAVAAFPGATFLYMNDADNLYIALEVVDGTFESGDRIDVRFDNALDGVLDANEDELAVNASDLFRDLHFSGSSWSVVDAQQDGTGAAGASSGTNFFEIAHPLDSGDFNDFGISSGDPVGYCIAYFNDGVGGSATTFPTDCPFSGNDLSGYGELVVE